MLSDMKNYIAVPQVPATFLIRELARSCSIPIESKASAVVSFNLDQ